MKTQKGFTLIELIIVIVVLGILAVTAAPQFFNFSSDARESTVNGLKGALNGSADIVFGKAAIEGKDADADDGATTADYQVTDDGVQIVYGYPAATDTGILNAVNITATDWDIAYDPATATVGTQRTVKFSPKGVNIGAAATLTYAEITDCFVSYQDVAVKGDRPVITANLTDC
ncbi:pilus assembly FimT family protein [Pseudidiomarina andamanensis]|uniref:Type II secretion system protein n=1 Tax=Pseudidiomarina andamanensis TaxID=1940690 RepID=A0AA92IME6_9GAMM|nr:prepilin-type N-terminal cleavage/methylation domain-containing protein [Pseudidiomarina andamanensis]QGT96541.1 type II secretion system protein [Pseudidiomarina andamanensis]